MFVEMLAEFVGANVMFGVSLVCFLYKDALWEVELITRRTFGRWDGSVQRGPDFALLYNVNGALSLAVALFIVVQPSFGLFG